MSYFSDPLIIFKFIQSQKYVTEFSLPQEFDLLKSFTNDFHIKSQLFYFHSLRLITLTHNLLLILFFKTIISTRSRMVMFVRFSQQLICLRNTSFINTTSACSLTLNRGYLSPNKLALGFDVVLE